MGLMIFTQKIPAVASNNEHYQKNKSQLSRVSSTDEGCIKYMDIMPAPVMCRFHKASEHPGAEIVALIGDSHAHSAYPGMWQLLADKKINTLIVAHSGKPPFLGLDFGVDEVQNKKQKNDSEIILKKIGSQQEIRKVFIFTRGPSYFSGYEPSSHERIFDTVIDPINFAESLQNTANYLTSKGKEVFYITENPELSFSPKKCLRKGYFFSDQECSMKIEDVLKRQSIYLDLLENMKNVTIIDSSKLFCNNGRCIVFDVEGNLLYADDDHLSISGSEFQAKIILKDLF